MYDGKFNLYSSDGSVTAGDVQLEYNLTPDGKSKEKWFNLYSTDGAFVTGFGAAGEIPLNDLYAGQSGDPHYSRYAGSLEYISRRQSVKPEDYVGTWPYGRCYITVEENRMSTLFPSNGASPQQNPQFGRISVITIRSWQL